MIAADALHRDDAARGDDAPRLGDRISVKRPRLRQQAVRGSAVRAGVRLRVKSAVGGIVILLLARIAHAERRHRRERTVVRHAADDGVARAAVRTVRKGVAVPTIARVHGLTPAVGADGEIGRDERARRVPLRAWQDAKILCSNGGNLAHGHCRHGRGERRLVAQSRRERIERRRRALRLDADARAVIEYPSGEHMTHSKPIDKRAKPDPLHDP